MREGILYADPKSAEQREEVATVCVRTLDIHFPALLDNMENTVGRLTRPGPTGFTW